VADAKETVTLISVQWSPGSLDARRFLRDLRRHSEPAGSVFWWDISQGEILLFVEGESPLGWFEERIRTATRDHVTPYPVYSNNSSRVSVAWTKPRHADSGPVSYRLVKFTAA
jgi:hypothetical protein